MILQAFMIVHKETILFRDTGQSGICLLSDTFINIDAFNFVFEDTFHGKQILKPWVSSVLQIKEFNTQDKLLVVQTV